MQANRSRPRAGGGTASSSGWHGPACAGPTLVGLQQAVPTSTCGQRECPLSPWERVRVSNHLLPWHLSLQRESERAGEQKSPPRRRGRGEQFRLAWPCLRGADSGRAGPTLVGLQQAVPTSTCGQRECPLSPWERVRVSNHLLPWHLSLQRESERAGEQKSPPRRRGRGEQFGLAWPRLRGAGNARCEGPRDA